MWEGFRALFLPSDEFKGAAGAQGVRTYLGTDGTAKGDTESSFDFTEDDTRASKTAPEAMDWANVSGKRVWMHEGCGALLFPSLPHVFFFFFFFT